MRRLFSTLGWVAAASFVSAASPALAQPAAPVQSEALRDWVGMKDRMMKIADAMPAEKFGYKSTPAQRSYAEQVMHVVIVDNQVLRLLRPATPAPATNPSATAKADVLKALSDSFDWGTTTIKEQSDQTMLQVEQVPAALQFLGPSTRYRVVSFLLGHTWDIYGQMAVYLRLNGIVPPASATP
jgi:uncharacterized damage-inducible protein DinB